MTRSEKREVAKLDRIMRMQAGLSDWGVAYLARSFSALIRASMTTKSRNEIINVASYVPAIVQHPEFIIG